MPLTESIVEDAALTWFRGLGYSCLGAEAFAPTRSQGERESYGEVVLIGRLREAIRQLNPSIPEKAREEALRKVLRVATPSLVQTNRAFHQLLHDGGCRIRSARWQHQARQGWLVDFSGVRA